MEDHDMLARVRARARHDYINEHGQEMPDPVPMAPPVGFKKEVSMFDQMRQMVRSEHLRLAALEAGLETFDESDDFDIPDDPVDPATAYEESFDPVEENVRMELRNRSFRAKCEARLREFEPVEGGDDGGQPGKNDVDKGGPKLDSDGSGLSDKKRKVDAKSVDNASNEGS